MNKVNLLQLALFTILLGLSSGIRHSRQVQNLHPVPRHPQEFLLPAKGNTVAGESFIDPYTEDLSTKPVLLKYWADDQQLYGFELTTNNKRGDYTNPFHGIPKGPVQEFEFPDQDIDHVILWYDNLSFKGLQIVFEDESSTPQIGGFSPIHVYYTIEGSLVGFFGTAKDRILSLGLVCNKISSDSQGSEDGRSSGSDSSSEKSSNGELSSESESISSSETEETSSNSYYVDAE